MMLEYFLGNPYFYSLALTLIHFIWQGCLVAFALKSALTLTSNKKPQLRYAFASLSMLTCLILPLITFAIIYQPDHNALALSNNLMPLFETSTGQSPNSNNYWAANIVEFLPYISVVWLSIVMLLTFKLLIEVYMVNQLPKQSIIPTDAKLSARFLQLVEKMQLSTTPRLLVSLKTDVPMAIGWLKPVILLPASMLSGLTPTQLEMLILHELAHIRRHDYLVNFIQTLVALLLFFHPAVQWISKQMRNEREYCSDDIAVQYCGDAIAYAHTLADTAMLCNKHRHHTIPNMAMAASGGDLKQRVIRLVDHHCTPSNDVGKWLAGSTIVVAIFGFGAQQYLTPGLFEMGTNNISVTETDASFVNHRNYQLPSLAKTSIARQLLTNDTSTPKRLSSHNIEKENKQVLANTILINTAIVKQTPKIKIDKQIQDIAAIEPKLSISNTTNIQLDDLLIASSLQLDKSETELPIDKKIEMIKNLDILAETSLESLPVITNANKTSLAINSLVKEEKSMAAIAFEKTDSSINSSAQNNVYAKQIAALSSPAENEPDILDRFFFENPSSNTIKVAMEIPIGNALKQPLKITQNNLTFLPIEDIKVLLPFVEKAKLISGIDPKYPANAKRKGLELEVRVQFTIDKFGRIKDIEFEQQNKVSYFRNSIKTAMRKWSFNPAKVDGQPVESQMSKIFSFSLTG
ncbi:MAG: M56 family metallopeptidase [Colwellia sp.]|nr:M56 family metallopeptidase [Colwellia sp.]